MDLCKKYGYTPDPDGIEAGIKAIAANLETFRTPEILKSCFSMMDLTTLRTQDTPASVLKLMGKVNGIPEAFPGYPMPASVCVYPNFAPQVRDSRMSPELHVTTVAGCFPSSQSYLEVKVQECRLAVLNGADEVDIVLALNSFLAGDYASTSAEIRAMRSAVDEAAASQGRTVVLKVILETGLLSTPELIAEASFLAMEAGADFIKTSTGKVDVNATPTAAYIMCQCIEKFKKATDKMVGFKAAGGISTADDALCYYCIVSAVLGPKWLDKKYFRFGVSRLGNNLAGAIERKTVNYF